jgi:hypothetical protein
VPSLRINGAPAYFLISLMEPTVSALQDMQLYTSGVGGKIILKCIFAENLDHVV